MPCRGLAGFGAGDGDGFEVVDLDERAGVKSRKRVRTFLI
jgi:hypothetical protein